MKELYGSVTYYGISKVLREYSKFPSFLHLPVSVQHGWYLWATKHDAIKYAPENWYWSKDIENKHKKAFSFIKTRTVGAPFLYLLDVIKYKEMPLHLRKGSIVFPAHSSKFTQVISNYEQYAELLDRLPDMYKPITVCVYHLDQERGIDKPFIDKGFSVVNNGDSLYYENFMCQFVNNTKDKLYAFANGRTSALLYASAMGLKVFYYGPKVKYKISNNELSNIIKDETYKEPEDSEKWKAFFAFPDNDENIQKAFCYDIMGKDYMLSPRRMKFLLFKLIFNWRYYFMCIYSLMSSFRPALHVYRFFRNKFYGNNLKINKR